MEAANKTKGAEDLDAVAALGRAQRRLPAGQRAAVIMAPLIFGARGSVLAAAAAASLRLRLLDVEEKHLNSILKCGVRAAVTALDDLTGVSKPALEQLPKKTSNKCPR
eukprot:234169-Rhodomonas_salina.3